MICIVVCQYWTAQTIWTCLHTLYVKYHSKCDADLFFSRRFIEIWMVLSVGCEEMVLALLLSEADYLWERVIRIPMTIGRPCTTYMCIESCHHLSLIYSIDLVNDLPKKIRCYPSLIQLDYLILISFLIEDWHKILNE